MKIEISDKLLEDMKKLGDDTWSEICDNNVAVGEVVEYILRHWIDKIVIDAELVEANKKLTDELEKYRKGRMERWR